MTDLVKWETPTRFAKTHTIHQLALDCEIDTTTQYAILVDPISKIMTIYGIPEEQEDT